MVWPPDSPWAPWWRTSSKIARAICRLAKVKKNDKVYDLGSGDGTALLIAASEFDATGVGIEIDPLRAFVSKIRVRAHKLSEKISIKRKNFFDVKINDATVIFVYLVPKALLRLKEKFTNELKPGTRIVSYRYAIPYLQLIKKDEVHFLYLYVIQEKSQKKSKARNKI